MKSLLSFLIVLGLFSPLIIATHYNRFFAPLSKIGRSLFSSPCPPNYFYSGPTQACFKVVRQDITHADAVAECHKEGAELATIHDQYENSVIRGLASTAGVPHMWIGLVYLESKAGWEWMDGMPLGYNNWDEATGNPVPPTNGQFQPYGYMNLNCCTPGGWANGGESWIRGGYICRAGHR